MTSQSLVVGSTVKFDCSSDLDPQSITWYRNGLPVASVNGSSKEVTIDPVSTDDQDALYSCTVISPYGSQEQNKTLSVIGWYLSCSVSYLGVGNNYCLI